MRADLAAFAVAALTIVGIILLSALGQPVPEVLVTVALVSVGAGSGASVPRARGAHAAA